MVSLLHEETNEIRQKSFVGCYAPWLKDGIFAVTNIGVKFKDQQGQQVLSLCG